jgi:hypothetical protein
MRKLFVIVLLALCAACTSMPASSLAEKDQPWVGVMIALGDDGELHTDSAAFGGQGECVEASVGLQARLDKNPRIRGYFLTCVKAHIGEKS